MHNDGGKRRGEELPYWLVNVSPECWPASCPDYLADADESDRKVLATRDEDYQPMTWDEAASLVKTNRLELFTRVPTQLRRYRAYVADITHEYGSVNEYVLKHRLGWSTLATDAPPFSNNDDVKILHNDWPYGLRANIVHLVVWLRFRLQEDATTGDLTVLARQQVHDFVDRTFRPQVDSSQVSMAAVDKLLWFRNWTSIKSVRGLEHFHVLLNNPDSTFIRHITNNDRPMANSRVTGKYSPIL